MKQENTFSRKADINSLTNIYFPDLMESIKVITEDYVKRRYNRITYKMNKKIKLKDMLFEMSNIRKSESGLPVNIWASYKNASHGPRIKVQTNYGTKMTDDFFSITISDEPKVIGKTGEIKSSDIILVKKFIMLNKELLLKFWKDEIGASDVFNNLKKL